jgi:purine-nucleoside phosphorylase
MEYLDKIKEASNYIISKTIKLPEIVIVLGTGLGALVDEIQDKRVIKYSDIPFFPVSTVYGHAGELILGYIGEKYIIAMNGRFHYYEGYSMKEITFAVRVFTYMGMKKLIISNACGGMNPEFESGDLMLITDHINLIGDNPLIGSNIEDFGPRFPDMSEAYSKRWIKLAEDLSNKLGISLRKGVYVSVSGPNFETPAELKMLRFIGADAVGMSTVPEVIAAKHGGMEILGVSCITDMALYNNLEPLDHEKVLETANRAKPRFVNLIKEVVLNL